MNACKNFLFIHLTPSPPEREEKEEGVFVFNTQEGRCFWFLPLLRL